MIYKTLIILLGFSLLSSCSPVYQLLNISPSGKLKEISYWFLWDTKNQGFSNEIIKSTIVITQIL